MDQGIYQWVEQLKPNRSQYQPWNPSKEYSHRGTLALAQCRRRKGRRREEKMEGESADMAEGKE